MGFFIMTPFLGRAPLLRTRVFQFTRTPYPVLLTRSLLTSPVLAKAKTAEDGDKPDKPRKVKTKAKASAKPKVKKASKPKPKPVVAKKKDLNVVKRPLSSWMIFSMEYMAKNKVPNVGVCNYTKEASAQWRTMSPEEKEKYKLSPEEKAKANEAVKEYRRTPEYRRAAKMYKVKVKAPYRMNAYMRFVKEYYDPKSTVTFSDQGRDLAARWRALSESDKDFWKQKTIEEKKQKEEATA